MLEINPSAVDFDFESILWFFIEMSSSVDPSTHELDPEFLLIFQVEMSRKLFELDPGNFMWTYWGKLAGL